MKISFLMLVVAMLVGQAYAQQTPDGVQRSSSPSGIQIQGDAAVRSQAQNNAAAAVGTDNQAKTATGAVRGNVQIRGNTRIDAKGRDVNAVSVGKGNQSDNAVGAIGGK